MSNPYDLNDAANLWFAETVPISRKVFRGLPSAQWGQSDIIQRALERVVNPPLTFQLGQIAFTGVDMPSSAKKAKAEKFNTIGVRFPETPGKEYTYKVRIGVKPYLGQELVVDAPRGQAVVFVTRIDKTPQEAPLGSTLKYVERKAVAL